MLSLTALAAPLLVAPGLVASVYASGGPLRTALTALLPYGGLVLLCDATSFIFAASLRGLGDVLWPTAIQIAVAAVLLPLAWWWAVQHNGGPGGLVTAILITSVLRAASLAARFRVRADMALLPGAAMRPQPAA